MAYFAQKPGHAQGGHAPETRRKTDIRRKLGVSDMWILHEGNQKCFATKEISTRRMAGRSTVAMRFAA
jgi:hypothetical protein